MDEPLWDNLLWDNPLWERSLLDSHLYMEHIGHRGFSIDELRSSRVWQCCSKKVFDENSVSWSSKTKSLSPTDLKITSFHFLKQIKAPYGEKFANPKTGN